MATTKPPEILLAHESTEAESLPVGIAGSPVHGGNRSMNTEVHSHQDQAKTGKGPTAEDVADQHIDNSRPGAEPDELYSDDCGSSARVDTTVTGIEQTTPTINIEHPTSDNFSDDSFGDFSKRVDPTGRLWAPARPRRNINLATSRPKGRSLATTPLVRLETNNEDEPLPDGWDQRTLPDGTTRYYVESATKYTTRIRPYSNDPPFGAEKPIGREKNRVGSVPTSARPRPTQDTGEALSASSRSEHKQLDDEIVCEGPSWMLRKDDDDIDKPQYFEIGHKRSLAHDLSKPTGVYAACETQYDEYLRNVMKSARDRNIPWPKTAIAKSPIRVLSQGSELNADTRGILGFRAMVNSVVDNVCVVENIDAKWIGIIGCEWNIPHNFFALHAANAAPSKLWQIDRTPDYNVLDVLYDFLERFRALYVDFNHLLQPGGPADKFYFLPTNGRDRVPKSNQQFLDDLARPVEGLRRAIAILLQADTYNLSGLYHNSNVVLHAQRVASYCEPGIEQLEANLQILKSSRSLGSEPDLTRSHVRLPRDLNIKYLDRLVGRLEEQLLRPARHISGLFEYPEDDFVGHSSSAVVTAPFFSRLGLPGTEHHPLLFSTNVSYYRVTRNLYLMLVDSPIPRGLLKRSRPGRERPRLSISQAYGYESFLLPQLFRNSTQSIFESMKSFFSHKWQTDALCVKTRLILPGRTQRSRMTLGQNTKLHYPQLEEYAAIEPLPFILLVSSHLWETNFRHLEATVKRISFRSVPNALLGTDDDLHACREDLALLKSAVISTEALIPAHMKSYYEKSAQFRLHRKATIFSPADNLRSILDRAVDLEAFLMNSFSVLLSSVSIKDSQTSIRQARRANLITILAFVYLPLTLVTGIFGMNIHPVSKKFDGAFHWQWVVWALLTGTGFTGLLYLLAYFINKWRHAETESEASKAYKLA